MIKDYFLKDNELINTIVKVVNEMLSIKNDTEMKSLEKHKMYRIAIFKDFIENDFSNLIKDFDNFHNSIHKYNIDLDNLIGSRTIRLLGFAKPIVYHNCNDDFGIIFKFIKED